MSNFSDSFYRIIDICFQDWGLTSHAYTSLIYCRIENFNKIYDFLYGEK